MTFCFFCCITLKVQLKKKVFIIETTFYICMVFQLVNCSKHTNLACGMTVFVHHILIISYMCCFVLLFCHYKKSGKIPKGIVMCVHTFLHMILKYYRHTVEYNVCNIHTSVFRVKRLTIKA